jgi:hypothetical protein
MPEDTWYAELRERYRPEHVKLLLIGESAPDPGAAERRFFYAPTLTSADNLFRGVVLALYDHRFPPGSAGSSVPRARDPTDRPQLNAGVGYRGAEISLISEEMIVETVRQAAEINARRGAAWYPRLSPT